VALAIAAIIGFIIGTRRARRAQRTITQLGSFNKLPIIPTGIVSAAIAVQLLNQFTFSWELFAYGLMCAMCVEQSLIDITTHRLTRSVTMRAAFIGGLLLSIAAIANNQPGKIGVMALSFTATLLIFMVLSLASRRGIGAGDVRLAAVLAMFLGYLGAKYVMQGLALGFMFGGVVALFLLISRKANRNTRIAFGPYICIGSVAVVLFGV
jgi:Type II secretory pathway, prepilin signal peptidase PulO and related peptidases